MFRPPLFAMVLVSSVVALTGLRSAEPNDDVQKLRQEVKKLQDTLAEREKQLAKTIDTINKLTAIIEATKAEQKVIDEKIKAEQDKVRDLSLQNKEYKAQAIKAQIEFQSALGRNKQLVEREKDLERKLALSKIDGPVRDVKNPPAEDLQGKITAVDATTGLVTVSLGSSAGLAKGNTLEVFRLKPKPEYVGMLRILDVREKDAIGKLIGNRGVIQVGDQVASRILGDKKP